MRFFVGVSPSGGPKSLDCLDMGAFRALLIA